jgi:hypothetical protein
MGATGWSYFVPYEADIAVALQRLREDIFVRGDYVHGDAIITEDQRKAFLEHVPSDWMQKIREQAEALEEPMRTQFFKQAEKMHEMLAGGGAVTRKQPRKPKTIEKLLKIQGESGTHSILDILGVSSEPKFANISPLPREKLVEFFGSETPSRALIEKAYASGGLEEFTSERWEGVYIVAYRDGLPAEIFFAGCSGD